uniref:DUF4939 domain-containing protein n=1 Tax=Sinocyclocheilus anshuiensis TaxID=1608454 RepID=A0A671KYB6_9TELE
MDPRVPTSAEVLEELVHTLRASLTPVTTPPSASVSPMAIPACYAGGAAECGGFLLQVALFIEMQPQKFSTERSKVAFLISLLTGRALLWARAIWNAKIAIINSYDAFTNHFKEVFVRNLKKHPLSHLTMWHSRMFLVSRTPPAFHLIGHETVPSTCCLG